MKHLCGGLCQFDSALRGIIWQFAKIIRVKKFVRITAKFGSIPNKILYDIKKDSIKSILNKHHFRVL